MQKFLQSYGTNLSSLARELESQQHMKTRIVELEEMNRSLENEQKSLHEKLLVLAKQQRFLERDPSLVLNDVNNAKAIVDENSSSAVQDTIVRYAKL